MGIPVQIGEKEYTMRPLAFRDVFTMSRILKKMDLDLPDMPKIPQLPADASDEDKARVKAEVAGAQWEVGFEIALEVAGGLGSAQNEVTKFIADLMEMDPEELASLPLDDSVTVIMALAKQPGLARFFELVGKSL